MYIYNNFSQLWDQLFRTLDSKTHTCQSWVTSVPRGNHIITTQVQVSSIVDLWELVYNRVRIIRTSPSSTADMESQTWLHELWLRARKVASDLGCDGAHTIPAKLVSINGLRGGHSYSCIILWDRSRSASPRVKWKVGCGMWKWSRMWVLNSTRLSFTVSTIPKKRKSTTRRGSKDCATQNETCTYPEYHYSHGTYLDELAAAYNPKAKQRRCCASALWWWFWVTTLGSVRTGPTGRSMSIPHSRLH